MIFTTIFAANVTATLDNDQQKCLTGCFDTDVNCQAKCLGVPYPDPALASKTLSCYNDCKDDVCRSQCQNDFITGVGVPVNTSSQSPDKNEATASSASYTSAVGVASLVLYGSAYLFQ
eukprot:NODE_849_length_3547_cov_0.451856.p3 type:complete len:118 gc:universal NODE_849_length_3547_cov_0.451856:60-413(+)